MADILCPVCSTPNPRPLDFQSRYANAGYFQCECGHIFIMDKQTGEFIRHITPPPEKVPPATPNP